MLYDDRRGAGEPLNETGQYGDGLIIRGKQYVMLDNVPMASYTQRVFGEIVMLEPELLFAEATESYNETHNKYDLIFSQTKYSGTPYKGHLTTCTRDTFIVLFRYLIILNDP